MVRIGTVLLDHSKNACDRAAPGAKKAKMAPWQC
jgi:hypothetical protein